MASNGVSGLSAYINWIWASGTQAFAAQYRTAGLSADVDMIDTTAGPDTAKTYVAGDSDSSEDLEIVLPGGSAGTPYLIALAPRLAGTLEVGPQGTASGMPKRSGAAFIKSCGEPLGRADVLTVSVTFQYSGAVTKSAYA